MQIIYNPYRNLNLKNLYKTNLHSHTTESDGREYPKNWIKEYSFRKYDILSLTDHDRIHTPQPTWPWCKYIDQPIHTFHNSEIYNVNNRDILAVQGNELSMNHHIISFLNNLWDDQEEYIKKRNNLKYTLKRIEQKQGLSFFCHPWFYKKHGGNWKRGLSSRKIAKLIKKFRNCLGIEIWTGTSRTHLNAGEDIWDEILVRNKKCLGIATDDAHVINTIGDGYILVYLSNLNEDCFRQSLIQGKFLTATEFTDDLPVITSIEANDKEIWISGEFDKVEWKYNKKVICEGPGFELKDKISYVRAVIHNGISQIYTQPFLTNYDRKFTF